MTSINGRARQAAQQNLFLGAFDLRVMQNFRVLAHGQGMVVRRWLFFRRHVGFHATRFVEAATAEDAGARVLVQLRGEARIILAAVKPPVLTIEEVEAIDGPIDGLPEPGLVFYPSSAHHASRDVPLNGSSELTRVLSDSVSREHQAEVRWSGALVETGLPTFVKTTAPAWFWDDQPRTTEGWSLICCFDSPPSDQGNPSRAQVQFLMDSAPHDRLAPGVALRLFEPATRQYATVAILD